ncbi:MAG: acyl-CoA desaturase [Proteobacteria bacterium]|nr:acyl-CoA desaturase [Pseudomonadota bacterium]
MLAIACFFVGHWLLSVFCQTFFLHRYGAHGMFSMSRGWERFFYLLTFFSQGTSFLNPRAYAILHREHHAFSDTEKDPHSPYYHRNLFKMMWFTLKKYKAHVDRTAVTEPRFEGRAPEWPLIDELSNKLLVMGAFAAAYVSYYIAFAPHWGYYLLLPVHLMMGPIHGAIVNWCGHKYGYRNFETTRSDRSRNTLIWDFVTLGELFQNNHHKFGMSPKFAARWFELDPTYPVIKVLAWLRVIRLSESAQRIRYPATATT